MDSLVAMTEQGVFLAPATSDEYCRRYAEVVCELQDATGLAQVFLYEELIALCKEWQEAVAADLASAEEGSAEFVAGVEATQGSNLAARLERCRISTQVLSGAIAQTFDMAVAKRDETINVLRIGAPAA